MYALWTHLLSTFRWSFSLSTPHILIAVALIYQIELFRSLNFHKMKHKVNETINFWIIFWKHSFAYVRLCICSFVHSFISTQIVTFYTVKYWNWLFNAISVRLFNWTNLKTLRCIYYIRHQNQLNMYKFAHTAINKSVDIILLESKKNKNMNKSINALFNLLYCWYFLLL